MIILTGMVLASVWYFFLKKEDVRAKFSAKTYPGTIVQTIKVWNKSLDNAEIVDQVNFNSLTQRITIDSIPYFYEWNLNQITDSSTVIVVSVNEPGNSFVNRLSSLFIDSEIEKNTKATLRDFLSKLNEHLDNINVEVNGLSEIESTNCVYIPIETNQLGKAMGMMSNYTLLSSFILDNEIQPNGVPIVEITEWDLSSDAIKFNFCYPIKETDSIPQHPIIRSKILDGSKAIKATYNGNYITSDRAWYALLYYAEKNGLKTSDLPIEVFYNNPNIDDNEKSWKAEIFLPVVE